jgi:Holliday junction resolvase-like predicted endonuclease
MKRVIIVKASGEREPFSEQKLRNSLKKINISPGLIDEIVKHIRSELRDGMTTSEIYRKAFSFLKKRQPHLAARYSLKKAIMELGPSGHPFERFVGKILELQGFSVKISQIVKGFCCAYEIDVMGEKQDQKAFVECKFHNRQGTKSDIKTALYVRARFEDIEKRKNEQGNDQRTYQAWLVTNTKLTSEAISYCNCVDVKVLGWNYPRSNSLQRIVEQNKIHPLTCLTSLNRSQKRRLLDQKVVLCQELLQRKSLLRSLGISEGKIKQIVGEINDLFKGSEK